MTRTILLRGIIFFALKNKNHPLNKIFGGIPIGSRTFPTLQRGITSSVRILRTCYQIFSPESINFIVLKILLTFSFLFNRLLSSFLPSIKQQKTVYLGIEWVTSPYVKGRCGGVTFEKAYMDGSLDLIE